MALLDIPEPIKKGLLYIASLTEEQFQELYTALEKLPLRINQHHIFDDSELKLVTISPDKFKEIRDVLFPLYLGVEMTDISVSSHASDVAESFASDVAESVRNQGGDNSDEVINKLRERLSRLLNIGQAKLIAKTNDVLTEHARTFSRARVFSDIRPVFGENVENPPQVAVIVHMLKINYMKDRQRREFVVALDTKDIQQLIDILERAKKKAKTLNSVISLANMSTVEIV